ncbi:MAG TPA: hypothetical protein VNO30_41870 [Kofleriaceae bacterium]|nr:hypothetical protein [Kofleriaceae bacterium]
MHRHKLTYVLISLVAVVGSAAAGAGCTVNGKPLLSLGAQTPAPLAAPSGTGSTGSTGSTGATSAGPVIAPAPYTWCKDLRDDPGASEASDLRRALDPEADAGLAVPVIMQALCYPREAARGQRAALEAARRTWMQRLLADERDWATDLVAWANLPHAGRMDALQHTVHPRPDVAWTMTGPLDQWALLHTRVGDSDAFALQPGAHHYIADALPLTEAGRLAFIERCMFEGGTHAAMRPVEWAICQPDIDELDVRKLAAEIRAASDRALADRMAIRAATSKVLRHRGAHAAAVAQLVARDPAYANLFDLARAMRVEWSFPIPSRIERLAEVRVTDDARARGAREALAGCSERIWPLFAAAVGRLPAQRFENLRGDPARAQTFFDAAIGAILQDPDAYLAANALLACEGAADHLLAALRAGLAYWPGFRGPRTAALTVFRHVNLVPDQRGEQIVIPQVALPLAIERRERSIDELRVTAVGTIATVTERGDIVRVTFPATSERQDQCASRRTTNRISRIDASGNVHYESVCTQWQRVRVDTTLRPVDVPRRYAAGLAPGRYVSIIAGIPEAVWATASASAPIAAFGALLR